MAAGAAASARVQPGVAGVGDDVALAPACAFD
jgi:hypothetical protein